MLTPPPMSPAPIVRPASPASISVVVTCYNSARFVADALKSILEQTRPPIEILVIDDGSTDDTAQVVASFDDPRIRYVHQENAGVSAARNRGIELARGDLIGFLDADDIWRPKMLEVEGALLDAAPDVALVFSDFQRFEDGTGRLMGTQFRNYSELATSPCRPAAEPDAFYLEGDAFCTLIRFADVPAFSCAMLYRRPIAAAVRFDPRLKVCEDMAFMLGVLLHGGGGYTRAVLCDVRRHSDNATKDYGRIPIFKLAALRVIEPRIDGEARRTAYQERLVRALLDAASLKIAELDLWKGLKAYAEALTTPGSWRRKIRATPRMLRALWRAQRRFLRRSP